MNLYWGDLHTHCAVSYGHGTAERALANAREHLDFCSITGHAFWPDMPQDLAENDGTMIKHYGGFAKLERFWPALLDASERANDPGSFVTFHSYEWHSMRYGDHNAYAKGATLPLVDAASPAALDAALRDAGHDALILPHHVGYAAGFRGLDWSTFDGTRSPLVEIFSNHGASEADDAPYPYHHNMGPRAGTQTAREGLVAGHRFGFQAGTDTHDGYPGHAGHGRVGVLADRLDRDALWEALKARRTIASTGARIEIDVTLDGAGPGDVVRRRDAMDLRLRVEGTDALARVEWIEGGSDGWSVRSCPLPDRSSRFRPGRHKVSVQTGWGRHGVRTSWSVRARTVGGRLRGATPYFRSSGHGNTETERTERVLSRTDDAVEWICRSLATPSGGTGGTHHDAGGPQAMTLELDADEETLLSIRANDVALDAKVSHLVRRSETRHLGGLSSPALVVARAAHESEFSSSHRETFVPGRSGPGFLYVRVLQDDGQAAWASPIFFD